jgi:hypothetical protein
VNAQRTAGGLALNRVAFGVGFLASPSSARSWIGPRAAAQPQTQVFVRALAATVALDGGARAPQQSSTPVGPA